MIYHNERMRNHFFYKEDTINHGSMLTDSGAKAKFTKKISISCAAACRHVWSKFTHGLLNRLQKTVDLAPEYIPS